MHDTAAAETVVKMAVQNTHATVRKQNKPARNRRPVFKAWTVSKLLETYKDPRATLLEIAGKDTKTLAAEMQASLADALAERRLCAQAVLPYVAQKLPVQVDMRHTRAIVLNIVDDAQYQELVTLDAQADDANNDDGFNMTLIAAAPVPETTKQRRESPAEQRAGIERNDLGTPVTPAVAAASPQGAAVTPGDRADPPGGYWLPPIEEWWRRLDGSSRTTPMPDAAPAAGDEPGRWRKTDTGTFGPGRPK